MAVDTVVAMATHPASPHGGSRHASTVRPILRRLHNAAVPVCLLSQRYNKPSNLWTWIASSFRFFQLVSHSSLTRRKRHFKFLFLLLRFLGVRLVARSSIDSNQRSGYQFRKVVSQHMIESVGLFLVYIMSIFHALLPNLWIGFDADKGSYDNSIRANIDASLQLVLGRSAFKVFQ